MWIRRLEAGLLGRPDRVAAELLAHRGNRLHRWGLLLARREAREQRRRNGVHRHGVGYSCLYGPASLAGVIRVTTDLAEPGIVLERLDQQVEQPRTYDGALTPRVEDRGDVVDHVDLLEELVALGISLHHGVLNAVVDHLGEVPGADPSGMDET